MNHIWQKNSQCEYDREYDGIKVQVYLNHIYVTWSKNYLRLVDPSKFEKYSNIFISIRCATAYNGHPWLARLRSWFYYHTNVETECKRVGLGLNGPKTKFLAYNIDVDQPLHTLNGTALEQKDDFKYLGSWSDSSEKDIQIRKALAWKALNDMARIWKSNMNLGMGRRKSIKC